LTAVEGHRVRELWETDPTRMCELLVGLPAVTVLGVEDTATNVVHVELRTASMLDAATRAVVRCAAARSPAGDRGADLGRLGVAGACARCGGPGRP
jgi:hypothetical protein